MKWLHPTSSDVGQSSTECVRYDLSSRDHDGLDAHEPSSKSRGGELGDWQDHWSVSKTATSRSIIRQTSGRLTVKRGNSSSNTCRDAESRRQSSSLLSSAECVVLTNTKTKDQPTNDELLQAVGAGDEDGSDNEPDVSDGQSPL